MWAYPIFGSLTRSTVNAHAGAKTQVRHFSSTLSHLFVLITSPALWICYLHSNFAHSPFSHASVLFLAYSNNE